MDIKRHLLEPRALYDRRMTALRSVEPMFLKKFQASSGLAYAGLVGTQDSASGRTGLELGGYLVASARRISQGTTRPNVGQRPMPRYAISMMAPTPWSGSMPRSGMMNSRRCPTAWTPSSTRCRTNGVDDRCHRRHGGAGPRARHGPLPLAVSSPGDRLFGPDRDHRHPDTEAE